MIKYEIYNIESQKPISGYCTTYEGAALHCNNLNIAYGNEYEVREVEWNPKVQLYDNNGIYLGGFRQPNMINNIIFYKLDDDKVLIKMKDKENDAKNWSTIVTHEFYEQNFRNADYSSEVRKDYAEVFVNPYLKEDLKPLNIKDYYEQNKLIY